VSHKFRISIGLLCLSCLIVSFSGCGIPGSPTKPDEFDDSVTLEAKVVPPANVADSVLAASSKTAEEVWQAFIASSTCRVNNAKVEFTLNATDATLLVEKLPPAAAYEISLRSGDIDLRAVTPYAGRKTVFANGLSLKTTADWVLRNAFATKNSFTVAEFAEYGTALALVTDVEQLLTTELRRSDANAGTVSQALDTALKNVLQQKTFTQIFYKNSPANDFDGDWHGNVMYYVFNSAGIKALVVTAEAKMSIKCSGSTAIGSLELTPTGAGPLIPDISGVSEPVKLAFGFQGTCHNGRVTFARKGRLGPLTGKDLDAWEIFPISRGLAFRVENRDLAYHTGLDTIPGQFVLQEKK
jgi:hypothetical protein